MQFSAINRCQSFLDGVENQRKDCEEGGEPNCSALHFHKQQMDEASQWHPVSAKQSIRNASAC